MILLRCGEVPSRNRSRFWAATSAVNFVPSVKVMSSRSFRVRTVLSSLYSHSVARWAQHPCHSGEGFREAVVDGLEVDGLVAPVNVPRLKCRAGG